MQLEGRAQQQPGSQQVPFIRGAMQLVGGPAGANDSHQGVVDCHGLGSRAARTMDVPLLEYPQHHRQHPEHMSPALQVRPDLSPLGVDLGVGIEDRRQIITPLLE